MAKLTLVVGVVLAALGIAFFVATGSAHKTALIPTWFGLVLILCGVLANTNDAGRRLLWMHIAVTAGLVGALFPGIRAAMALLHAHRSGAEMSSVTENAVHEELAMALVCLIFTVACVRSFISARRSRIA